MQESDAATSYPRPFCSCSFSCTENDQQVSARHTYHTSFCRKGTMWNRFYSLVWIPSWLMIDLISTCSSYCTSHLNWKPIFLYSLLDLSNPIFLLMSHTLIIPLPMGSSLSNAFKSLILFHSGCFLSTKKCWKHLMIYSELRSWFRDFLKCPGAFFAMRKMQFDLAISFIHYNQKAWPRVTESLSFHTGKPTHTLEKNWRVDFSVWHSFHFLPIGHTNIVYLTFRKFHCENRFNRKLEFHTKNNPVYNNTQQIMTCTLMW